MELTALGGFDSDAAANLSPTDETPMLVYPENKIILIHNYLMDSLLEKLSIHEEEQIKAHCSTNPRLSKYFSTQHIKYIYAKNQSFKMFRSFVLINEQYAFFGILANHNKLTCWLLHFIPTYFGQTLPSLFG